MRHFPPGIFPFDNYLSAFPFGKSERTSAHFTGLPRRYNGDGNKIIADQKGLRRKRRRRSRRRRMGADRSASFPSLSLPSILGLDGRSGMLGKSKTRLPHTRAQALKYSLPTTSISCNTVKLVFVMFILLQTPATLSCETACMTFARDGRNRPGDYLMKGQSRSSYLK